MRDDDRKRIEEIIGEIQCPKNYNCAELDFENLCKAKDIGLGSYLICLEENSQQCKFAVRFGETYFCKCPLRVYLAKNLKK